ncbi:hypothetical protein [Halorhabdus rudnickae]|uniref:hypothetical protein n=1 Tax=Halorhabdus rudnickae TaxID=1775544 RepID=UPI0010841304|nr:hypothetical protein [Halorhabdus rudnickae]
MLSYTDGRDYLGHDTTNRFDGWGFRLGGPSPSTRTLAAVGPDDQMVRLSVGNYVWHTQDRTSKAGMRQLETRRGRIAEMEECRDGEYLALVDFGEGIARIDAREIAVSIATGEGDSKMVATTEWALEPPEMMDFDDRRQMRWIDLLEETGIPEPDGIDDLTFERMSGRGSRKTVMRSWKDMRMALSITLAGVSTTGRPRSSPATRATSSGRSSLPHRRTVSWLPNVKK